MTQEKLEQYIREDTVDQEQKHDGILLSLTWNSKTGRCTALALKVSKRLEHSRPTGIFNFDVYDLGKHRLARCRNTYIVIDSSSRTGALTVPPQKDWTCRWNLDLTLKWKWTEGESSTTRKKSDQTQEPTKVGKGPISDTTALALCMSEVAKDAVLMTLFRSSKNAIPMFHGMVKWVLDDPKQKKVPPEKKSRYLYLQPSLGDREYFVRIIWNNKGSKGTVESNQYCLDYLHLFVQNYGGPHGNDQWDADDGDIIHNMIWNSLNQIYGYPV